MAESNKLNIKEWYDYYLKNDHYFGNIIASVLQYVYKNKASSLIALSKTIKKNPSIILPGEGTVDLLLKIKNLIEIMPKFYVTNFISGTNEDPTDDFYSGMPLTLKCDFVIKLNFNMITDLSGAYIEYANNVFSEIEKNNKKIVLKYLYKNALLGNYFIPKDFLEHEIFQSFVGVSGYAVLDIEKNFNLIKYTTADDLINVSNFNEEKKEAAQYIKILNLPFTSVKMNGFFSSKLQKIFRDKYSLGKNEINIKILYLDAEYYLKNEKKKVIEILADQLFDKYFNNKALNEKKSLKDSLFSSDFSLDNILNNDTEAFGAKTKNFITNDEYYEVVIENNLDRSLNERGKIREVIIRTLKNEKVHFTEVELLSKIERAKLKTKRVFADTLDVLSSPFLSQIIDTGSLRFLKQYLIINYGEELKESVTDEIKEFIEKKFFDYLKSGNSKFMEYFSEMIENLSEFTDEKEYIVETVLKSSFIFNNLVFKKYLVKQRSINTRILGDIIKNAGYEFSVFTDSGDSGDLMIIPFIKIKEFLIYLATEEISLGWGRLSGFFNTLIPFISSSVYTGSTGDITISIASATSSNYELVVKNKNEIKNFIIKSPEDIEYIFKQKELEKIRFAVTELYNLHAKTGFGFNNKNDYLKYLDIYKKRAGQYFYYKKKADDFESSLADSNIISIVLKKIIYWFSISLNEHHLYKISKKNNEILKKVNYYYLERDKKPDLLDKENVAEIKEKISSLLNMKKEKLEALRSKGGYEIRNADEYKAKQEELFRKKSAHLEDLPYDERALFEKIKKYLLENKDLVFLHNPNINDENIVIYIKNKVSRNGRALLSDFLTKENEVQDINTVEQVAARYFMIRNLAKKGYLIEKCSATSGNDKKLHVLYLPSGLK